MFLNVTTIKTYLFNPIFFILLYVITSMISLLGDIKHNKKILKTVYFIIGVLIAFPTYYFIAINQPFFWDLIIIFLTIVCYFIFYKTKFKYVVLLLLLGLNILIVGQKVKAIELNVLNEICFAVGTGLIATGIGNILIICENNKRIKIERLKELDNINLYIEDVVENLFYDTSKSLKIAISDFEFINYDDFLNENGTFVVDEVKGLISNYLSYVNVYLKSIEEFFIEPNFIAFLKDRPDLINSTLIYDNIKLMDEYKKLYYNQGIELLLSGYNSIRDNVLYSLLGMRDFTSSLELHENGNVIPNISLNQRYNSGIKTNFIDGSLKCFELAKTNNSNIENGYFSIEGGYTELITKLIFTKHYWKNLNNRFDTSDGTELTKSEYDNTICFWRKHKGSSLDEVTYISFTFNNSSKCDFIIKGYSIENYNDNNKTSLNFNVNDLYTKYNDEWQLWCIKIDNEHVFDDTTSYSGKIGITCEVYVNEIVNGEYSIKKYVLNGESTSPFNVESPLFNKNDYWKNSKIYIGYSKFVESLNLNKNYFTGYIRNLMLFAGHLTESECRALFKAGIQSNYNFSSEYIDDSLLELFESKKFFIGLVGVYNVTNINILNCVMKYNGKYLK